MNINSIGQNNHQTYFGSGKTTASSSEENFSAGLERTIAEAAAAAKPSEPSIMYVQTSSGKKSLLDKNALISICQAPTGESANVYKAEGYSESNPLYFVKGTDQNGNIYEQVVDVSEVNPENCSYVELLALSAHTGHTDFLTMGVIRDQAADATYHEPQNYLSMAYDRMNEMKLLKQWDSYLRYNGWITDILDYLRSNNKLM